MKMKNFVLLAFNFAWMTTVYDLIALLVGLLVANVGYSSAETGSLGVLFCIGGVIGLVVIKFMID